MSDFVNAGARLDRLPMTGYHRRLMWLVGLGMVCDTFDLGLQSSVAGATLGSHFATFNQTGYFISATFAGMTMGAALAGLIGDRFGRRFCYQFNLLVFGLASFAAALAPTMEWLILFRGIIGIGLGAEIVVGYSLIAEFVPPASRGRLVATIVLGAIGFCGPFTYVVSYLIVPEFGWRWMFVIPAVGATIIWFLRKDMPESPRWLESVGRGQEADRVIRIMEAAAAELGPLPPVPMVLSTQALGRIPLSVLFTRPVIRRTLLVIVVNIAIGAGSYGFGAFIPTFFVKQGMSITRSLGFGMVMAFGSSAATILAWWLADKIGRKWGIVASTLGAAALGLIYPWMTQPLYLLTAGFLMVMFMSFQMAMGITIYAPELFPTEYRLRGNAVGNVAGRITSMLAPYATMPLYNNFGVAGVTVTLAGLCFVVSVFVAVFGVETRRRSLELIDATEPILSPEFEGGGMVAGRTEVKLPPSIV
jgi:MFS transporter, putative metabolite:H+ symporter